MSLQQTNPIQYCQSHDGIVYRTAVATDAESIASLCLSDFYPRNPLFLHLGITSVSDVQSTISALPYIISHGVSLVAEIESTKELVGARLSVIEPKDGPRLRHPLLTDPDLASKYQKHSTIMRLVDHNESLVDYFKVLGVDRALAFKILVVKASRGCCGIGRRLVEASLEVGRQLEIRVTVVSAQNRYAQKIFESLGFQRLSSVEYSEYTDSETGVRPFRDLAENSEHKESMVFYKIIN